jgi:hypothetical protein
MPFKSPEKREEYERSPARRAAQKAHSQAYHQEHYQIPEFSDRRKAAATAYRKANPERVRNFKYRHSYGITVKDYEVMVAAQNNKCAICGLDGKDNRYGKLSVDHCHSTRKIRGLLCNSCNHMIGKAKDNADILSKAAAYLRERS